MDLDELRSFAAVVRLGSISRAADGLGLTQPAVTRQLQRLERELECKLVERRGRGIVVTPAGKRFESFARETLDRHRTLLHKLGRKPLPVTGDLLIAASTTPGEFLVPDLLAGFTAQHPQVRPRVFIGDSASVIGELLARRYDVGFVGSRLRGSAIQYEAIGDDEVVLAVPDSHPFAARTEISPSELTGEPFLEREAGSGTQLTFRAELAKRKLPVPAYSVTMVLTTTQSIVSAVEAGTGIGLVSAQALMGREAEGAVPVRLAGVPLRRALYLVVEKGRRLPEVAATFAHSARLHADASSVDEHVQA